MLTKPLDRKRFVTLRNHLLNVDAAVWDSVHGGTGHDGPRTQNTISPANSSGNNFVNQYSTSSTYCASDNETVLGNEVSRERR